MKKYISRIKSISIPLILGLALGWIFFGINGNQSESETHIHEESVETIWTCSMHPQIKQNKPGLCPICAMDLIPLEKVDSGEEVDPNELPMTESAIKLADVQIFKVIKGNTVKNIPLQGKIEADERNISSITARFGGRIEKLYVNFTGQQVKKGQKLASIYSPELVTAQKELLESMKLKSSNPSFYEAARSKLILLDLTKRQIDGIEKKGEPKIYFDYLSPLSGTVTKRNISLGEYKKEGDILFEVLDLSKVWVLFDAYESDLPWIKLGDNVEFDVPSLSGKRYKGVVKYIDPLIEPATRVAKVRVELNNPGQRLKPEMLVKGLVESQESIKSPQIIIPKSAVLWTGKRSVVYVKIPDREVTTFIYREIVLGPESGNYYVVNKGLEEGEEIAMNGVFKLDAAAQLAGKKSMMSSDINEGIVHHHVGKPNDLNDLKSVNFKVGGACGMCKSRIEKVAKSFNGVGQAEWNQETKILSLSYNPELIKLIDIHKAIAKAGHDTDKVKAEDEVYNKLPGCCKYRSE